VISITHSRLHRAERAERAERAPRLCHRPGGSARELGESALSRGRGRSRGFFNVGSKSYGEIAFSGDESASFSKMGVGEAVFGRADCPRGKSHLGSENDAFRWELTGGSVWDIGRRWQGSGGGAFLRPKILQYTGSPPVSDFLRGGLRAEEFTGQ
jgi:hypothetical protein